MSQVRILLGAPKQKGLPERKPFFSLTIYKPNAITG
jgi:hypothetical protein